MTEAEWILVGVLLLVPAAILTGRYLRWLSDRHFKDSVERDER